MLSMPVVAYVLIYTSNRYSFRNSLTFEPVPASGYESRIAYLNSNEQMFFHLGFRKIDEFYLKTSHPVVAYVYRHEQYPVLFWDYDMQVVKFCDLVTRFDNGYSLTTTNGKNGGAFPRPDEHLLQAFPLIPADGLLDQHLQGVQFLTQREFHICEDQTGGHRERFLEQFLEAGEKLRTPLSPIQMVYSMATNYKERHAKPIRDQVFAKTVRMP